MDFGTGTQELKPLSSAEPLKNCLRDKMPGSFTTQALRKHFRLTVALFV